mmetsp:Transcript_22565/g.49920  ORF Transcript_22565/g.49920 Transcript_22565/m.49920 type:complete len:218 (+) Transcript_22565:109-762(+)
MTRVPQTVCLRTNKFSVWPFQSSLSRLEPARAAALAPWNVWDSQAPRGASPWRPRHRCATQLWTPRLRHAGSRLPPCPRLPLPRSPYARQADTSSALLGSVLDAWQRTPRRGTRHSRGSQAGPSAAPLSRPRGLPSPSRHPPPASGRTRRRAGPPGRSFRQSSPCSAQRSHHQDRRSAGCHLREPCTADSYRRTPSYGRTALLGPREDGSAASHRGS